MDLWNARATDIRWTPPTHVRRAPPRRADVLASATMTNRSRFQRIAAAAATTGARFMRERIGVPPLLWLSTPKRLLDGRTPMDACRTAEGLRRVTVLHDLSLGLDVSPDAVSDIVRSMPRADGHESASVGTSDDDDVGSNLVGLYTATIVHEDERGTVQVYVAMIAGGPEQVRSRLRARLGRLLEEEAEVRFGFDWSEPLACALVSGAMADALAHAAAAPLSSIAHGLDLQIENRFRC